MRNFVEVPNYGDFFNESGSDTLGIDDIPRGNRIYKHDYERELGIGSGAAPGMGAVSGCAISVESSISLDLGLDECEDSELAQDNCNVDQRIGNDHYERDSIARSEVVGTGGAGCAVSVESSLAIEKSLADAEDWNDLELPTRTWMRSVMIEEILSMVMERTQAS
jgi:hypothetical protein